MLCLKIMLHLDHVQQKIHSTLIGNAEDCNIVMSMYNLLEYNQNNSMISGGLWNYYRDEINDTDDNA